VLLPYHALDLYDRFAVGEFVAFLWFPLLFAAVRRLSEGPSSGAWLLLTLSYAGLLLTHLVTAFMVLFMLGPYALWRVSRARSWSRLLPMLAAGATALLLSATFLVPMLAARPHVYVGGMVEGWFDWWRNFVYNMATVQLVHRAFFWLLALAVPLAWWRYRGSAAAQALAAMFVVQAALGISTLLLRVPVVLGAAHQAGAVLVLAAALWLAHGAERRPRLAPLPAAAARAS